MINVFIAALVATFFWGKVSKDVEEQTQLASWVRMLVYGALAFAVGVFYVKTYQVATVYNGLEIVGVRESLDSLGNNTDTIDVIRITNRFSAGITENREEKKIRPPKNGSSDNDHSGIFIAHSLKYGDDNITRTKKEILADPYSVYASGFNNIPLDDYSHLYQTNVITSLIPSIIPFFPSFFSEGSNPTDLGSDYFLSSDLKTYNTNSKYQPIKQTYIKNTLNGEVEKHEAKEEAFHESVLYMYTFGDTLKRDKTYQAVYSIDEHVANVMNFFTAADISQYTLGITIATNCYVKNIVVTHDVPIEIMPYDSCMTVTSHSIFLNEKFVQENLKKQAALPFHVKLPTLENMQLIRSLILTTILTALVSLFCCNVYYLIRKYAIKFKDSHVSQISEVRVKKFKIKMYTLLFVILGLIVYISFRILFDNPFHIPENILSYIYEHYLIVSSVGVLLFSVFLYMQFRSAYTIKKKK